MYCCHRFENAIADAGERGLAVLVERTREGIAFVLQSRGIAHVDVRDFPPSPGENLIINVSSDSRIRYCPWGGRTLQDLARGAPDHFANLATQHNLIRSGPSEV